MKPYIRNPIYETRFGSPMQSVREDSHWNFWTFVAREAQISKFLSVEFLSAAPFRPSCELLSQMPSLDLAQTAHSWLSRILSRI